VIKILASTNWIVQTQSQLSAKQEEIEMRVVMIGTGYVGLVSGACFADFGHQVICVDKDVDKIASLTRGEMPIYEPGLAEVVRANVAQNRLQFTSDLKSSVATADVVFIAVGTPSRRGDGHADLSYVSAAAKELAGALCKYTVIATKSTVPVGANAKPKWALALPTVEQSLSWPSVSTAVTAA